MTGSTAPGPSWLVAAVLLGTGCSIGRFPPPPPRQAQDKALPVSGLFTTVLRGLPSGAAVVLEVGDEEKFVGRTLVDGPDSGEKVNEQLLDGHQRLTAL